MVRMHSCRSGSSMHGAYSRLVLCQLYFYYVLILKDPEILPLLSSSSSSLRNFYSKCAPATYVDGAG